MRYLSDYLILLLIAVVITLPLEFFGKLGIYRRYKDAIKAISLPFIIFIIWDILFSQTDLWNFSDKHTYSFRLLGLPIEEILFFIVIPLAGLLTYNAVSTLNSKFKINVSIIHSKYFIVLYIAVGLFVYKDRVNSMNLKVPTRIFPYYTLSILFVFIAFIVWVSKSEARKSFIKSADFYYSIVICMMFMILFNGWLTMLDDPTVTYRANAGPRIYFDMPIEDIFYGFVLLSWVLLRFHLPKEKVEIK